MTHEAQQIAYNAGWCKGRWPRDRHYGYSARDFASAADYRDGMADGRKAALAAEQVQP